MKPSFKGNKQSLPRKLCAACGRDMTWRKAWAKNWEQVLYCSDRCRKQQSGQKLGHGTAPQTKSMQGQQRF